MAVQSYIGLVNYIENFAQNHLQIRRFKAEFDEQLPNFATETEAYPILFMSPSSNVYADNDDRFVVNFYCFDVIQKDRSNINTIYSDTSLILNDLKKFIKDGDNYLFNVDSIEATAIPINNALLDYVAGVQMQLIIQVDTYSYCEIPLDDGILVPTTGIDVVYSQYLTCETVTGCTTLQDYITSEVQSQASTTFSGGTVVNDAEFLSNVTIEGNTYVSTISGNTAYLTNYYSGGTSLEQVINNLIEGAEDITRVQPGSNVTTGGTDNFPIVNVVDSPSFNNIAFSGTATGGDMIVNGLSATTIFSAGTNLNTIITTIAQDQGDKTRVQPGTNINTGGTENFPVVNLNDNISVTSISAATIYSGSTNLGTILENYTTDGEFAGHTANTSNPHQVTAAQVGAYTISETNNLLNTKANLSGATFTGTINAPIIQSGGTDLYTIFSTIDTNDITRVQPGVNITTGGTENNPTVNLVASPSINNLTFSGTATGGNISAGSVSATTFYSGSTNLNTIITTIASGVAGGDVTRVQNGLNTYTGGTGNLPTINISAATLNNLSVSGTSVLATTSATTIAVLNSGTSTSNFSDYNGNVIESGTSLSNIIGGQNNRISSNSNNVQIIGGDGITGGTSGTTYVKHLDVRGNMLSGGTNLYNIFSTTDTNDITRVQPGTNITTGGTANAPTVNLTASPIVNNLTFSGTAIGGTVQAGAGTFTSLSATTLSGGTILSGGTNLNSIFGTLSAQQTLQSQITTKANLSGATFTGAVVGTSISATTLSGGTILSGGTNLYNIFSTTDTNDITRVQPGSNITTGGTDNLPTISLAASPAINGLTFSGTATGTALSATTLSGGTIFSGGTNLYSIFLPQAGTIPYDFMAAASDETTAITTGTSKVTFLAPRTFTLTGITVSLVTSGSTTTTVDVNYNGSSVFATPISIASATTYATTATTTTAISKYGKFTVDFDAVGTGSKGVKVTLEGRTTI